MKNLIFIFCFMFVCSFVAAGPLEDWGDFESRLRKGTIASAEAEFLAKKLTKNLGDFASEKEITEDMNWAFPISGFSKNDIANIKKFYKSLAEAASDTKFFDGELFLAQPYLDLEVSSKTKTVLPSADVVAVNNAIVVYAKKGALTSASGNCVWLFNPAQNFYIYYGYLRNVDVKVGDMVKTGDKIGSIRPTKKGYRLKFTVLIYGDEKFGLYTYLDDMP